MTYAMTSPQDTAYPSGGPDPEYPTDYGKTFLSQLNFFIFLLLIGLKQKWKMKILRND
jgi:putative copper export protein